MSLVSRLLSRLWSPVRSRIMSLVDDRKQIGNGEVVVENQHLIRRRDLIATRLGRAASQPVINNTQYRTITYGSCVGPHAGAMWGTGEEIMYPISVGTGERMRLGTDIFVRKISFNGLLTTANGDAFDKNGAYLRLLLVYQESNGHLVQFSGGGATWYTERTFVNSTPSAQGALVTGPTRDDDPRFCILYDSGIKHIGGTENPATQPLSFDVQCGFRTQYADTVYGAPSDVVHGQVLAFLVACMAGEDASTNSSSTPKQVWWIGNVGIDYSNIQ